MNITKKITDEAYKGGNSKAYIIVHHTASSPRTTFDNIVNFFIKKDYISIHYIVGREGEIVQTVEENDRAFHAGISYWKGVRNLNHHSIGIEVFSDGKIFNDKQRDTVVWLCRDIMKRNNIPAANVLRHADIAPGRKTDIGESFYVPAWGSWAGFQKFLDKKEDKAHADNLRRLERLYARQAERVNRELNSLNNIKKRLADIKGVKYKAHFIV